jgi:hypothetical protein
MATKCDKIFMGDLSCPEQKSSVSETISVTVIRESGINFSDLSISYTGKPF